VLPAECRPRSWAAGNPLNAEEFIRMLKDRELLVQRGRTWELAVGAEIPFPESVQGLIAARLDTLSPERKALLQDAAVLGKVFWAGAVAAMSRSDDAAVRDALHELTRKELVRTARQSSMEGESEYGFWHMLVRDVAYAQIPRAARAGKHVAAAEWIEERAGERAEDLADVLAYHYAEALDLVEASGGDTTAVSDRALHFLMLAGDGCRP
jgi:predicted ATPase